MLNFYFGTPRNWLIDLQKTEQEEHDTIKTQIANLLQDTMEIITQDIMKNGQG